MISWLRNAYFTSTSFTDHKAYTVRIVLPDLGSSAGRGVWSLMPQILDDPENMQELERKWIYWVRNRRNFPSWIDWWNSFCKPKLASFLKWRTSVLYNDFHGTMGIYQGQLSRAYDHFHGQPQQRSVINKIKGQMLHLQRNFSSKMRRNNSTYVGGEQTTLFHVNDRCTRKARTSINSLTLQNGNTTSNADEIQSEVTSFFRDLYTSNGERQNFSFLPSKTISPDNNDNNTVMRIAEQAEVLNAIKTSCSRKSPGIDGLPKEFFLKTWRIIAREFTLVVNEALSGNIPKNFLDGIIVLVKKKGSRNNSLANFRPISLLNFDYKIVSRILKQRMEKLLPLVLSSHQKCSNGTRTIFEATSRILDKICETKNRKRNSLLVSFDLDHAFDRVEHRYLHETMARMNFNTELINLIMRIMANSYSRIMVNGSLSPEIRIQRSVRQGDPLSMFLFVLFLQPLLDKLSQSFPNCVMNAYADDISMFFSDERLLERVIDMISDFGEESGALLNRSKTVALMIGNMNLTERTDWLVIENHVKILGIYFSENIRIARDLNWNSILSGIHHRIWTNSPRTLCLTQKVTLLNVYVCSKMWYVASNMYLPKNFEARILTELRKYLWLGYPAQFKVAIQNLNLPKDRGGLNLHSPGTKAKSLLVNRILQTLNELPFAASFLQRADNPPNIIYLFIQNMT